MAVLKPRLLHTSEKRGLAAKQYAFLETQSKKFPKLEANERNEHAVRTFLMKYWTERYAKKHAKHMASVKALFDLRDGNVPGTFTKADDAKLQKMLRDKYYRVPQAYDLSGACLLTAQFCYIVFDLPGEVVSNPHHTFIYDRASGVVNDLNMYCTDVLGMSNPYEYNQEYSESAQVVARLRTWNTRLQELLVTFAEEQLAYSSRVGGKAEVIEALSNYLEKVDKGACDDDGQQDDE